MTRQIEIGLVIISNLFYLEAAYEDILDIKRINSHLTFIGYIKHICCCKTHLLPDVQEVNEENYDMQNERTTSRSERYGSLITSTPMRNNEKYGSSIVFSYK